MPGRIVEIAADHRHLSVNRGFLVVSADREELGRIPLDEIAAVVINGHGCTHSNNALVELANQGSPVVLCGPNHLPQAIVWAADGHHQQAGRMADQASAAKPLKKRLWQQIVRAKIRQQGATLRAIGAKAGGFELLARQVRSGDPANIEAQASRRYWPLLFGPEFRRDTGGNEINSLLNYGYSILRSGAARAIMASGLHPSLGLFHANRGNAFCLVDDLMEPFRPIIDRRVFDLRENGVSELDRETKSVLAGVLILDMTTRQGATPMVTCLERAALSLARCFGGEADGLDLPDPPFSLNG